MAYTNPFPVSYPQYQQMYQQPQYMQQPMQQVPQPTQQAPQPQTQSNNNIIWVQGEGGAKSYLVAPNNTVQLWDSEDQVIYLKSADASGMPSMKILDYTIRDTSAPQVQAPIPAPAPAADYVTREELEEFEIRIRKQLDKLSNSKRRKDDVDE